MRTQDEVAAMQCPVCRVPLAMSDRQGIEIDYCPQCRGVWLDRGELDKIIERSAPQGSGARPGARRARPSRSIGRRAEPVVAGRPDPRRLRARRPGTRQALQEAQELARGHLRLSLAGSRQCSVGQSITPERAGAAVAVEHLEEMHRSPSRTVHTSTLGPDDQAQRLEVAPGRVADADDLVAARDDVVEPRLDHFPLLGDRGEIGDRRVLADERPAHRRR